MKPKVGDIVRHKVSSVDMTIISVCGSVMVCQYVSDNNTCIQSFSVDSLDFLKLKSQKTYKGKIGIWKFETFELVAQVLRVVKKLMYANGINSTGSIYEYKNKYFYTMSHADIQTQHKIEYNCIMAEYGFRIDSMQKNEFQDIFLSSFLTEHGVKILDVNVVETITNYY